MGDAFDLNSLFASVGAGQGPIRGGKTMNFGFRMHLIRALMCLLPVLAGACTAESPAPVATGAAGLAALLERDAAFARMSEEQGVAVAYQAFLAADAVQLPDGDLPVYGKDAIYQNILASLTDEQVLLTWTAESGAVADSGDLGYTWGTYYFESIDASGEVLSSEGKYVNVWRREAGGEWQVVIDISNASDAAFIEPVELSL